MDNLNYVIEKNVVTETNNSSRREAHKVGGDIFIFLKMSSLYVGYEWLAEQAFDADVKSYNQSNLQKNIYSERIFIEIIVIIVKKYL